MTSMRWAAAVVVGVLLATGLVRGATGQFGSIRDRAKKALESSAKKNDVELSDSISLPAVLASLNAIAW